MYKNCDGVAFIPIESNTFFHNTYISNKIIIFTSVTLLIFFCGVNNLEFQKCFLFAFYCVHRISLACSCGVVSYNNVKWKSENLLYFWMGYTSLVTKYDNNIIFWIITNDMKYCFYECFYHFYILKVCTVCTDIMSWNLDNLLVTWWETIISIFQTVFVKKM